MKSNPILRYSLLLSGLLVAYFLIMRAFGLIHITEFRVFNIFIIFGVIAYQLKEQKQLDGKKFDYFRGLANGFQTAAISILFFAVFIGVYCAFDSQFMQSIKAYEGMGRFLNPITVAVAVAMEGLGMGFLATFISLQILKPKKIRQMEENY